MSKENEEDIDENIFDDIPSGTHTPKKSVATEINIPNTNFSFCVLDVSYKNGKVTVKTSLETREYKSNGITMQTKKDIVILQDCYVLDVSHLVPEKKN